MDAKPVVFALVIGWLAGSGGLPDGLSEWLTARETIGAHVQDAACVLNGSEFTLRQVVLDAGAAR